MRRITWLSIGLVLLLVIPTLSPLTTGFHSRKTIKVAFLRQKWDILDALPIKDIIIMKIYRHILKEAEDRYNVRFKIYELWDSWNSGDVQSGKLRKLGIDTIVMPGGFGSWDTPKRYRLEIKNFVRRGGGFYGICGDSTFGSLGVVNLPSGYRFPLKRITGSWSFTPMLGLANVYTDATPLSHILKHPLFFTKLEVFKSIKCLPFSRAAIKIKHSKLDIQQPYEGKYIRVMLGNAPLVDGPLLFRLFKPKVYTIAVFVGTDKPYDKSIEGKKAIVATHYGKGNVILSVVHPELTIGNNKAHDIFIRNLLWTAKALPVS